MRKAEEIILDHYGCTSLEELRDYLGKENISVTMLVECIRIAQEDAIRATVKECADKVRTCNDPYSYCGNTGSEYPPDIIVDKQSILSVADKLIKEL